MEPVSGNKFFLSALFAQLKNETLTNDKTVASTDSAEISNTARVFDKLDKFLNLGRKDRLDIGDLNEAEKEEFMKMLATLIKRGIVGYEVLEINGKPEKHYIVNQIGNERTYGARLYNKKGYYRD
ncbi:hypothetical protein MROS_0877 [Melioribacter roseus P3M-2]|uniref:Uncharacterized protein n=1 Tax=Melioribacter roseus (strain DSM 23840 / JCM 17771 / VKM B-2668 / P3M-2) TaxID=1191523 RepID=I6ZYM0_MELRP|nr:hypothetical protein [Melioribacter roseus]AFN74118.1 hypothetical protein MROS_0877 [Melioribacter roseus P3M-2]